MQKLSHIISNHIFIFATSLAMLVHSTWTFGTLFSGTQPELNGLDTLVPYLMWVTPALLVALAIDVGQIQTSVKLSKASGWKQRIPLGITFITLALAGYYLQWYHLAHHIPALEFGSGLTEDVKASLGGLKDIAIFVIPALLPLSTILYTMSSSHDETVANEPSENTGQLPQIDVNFPALEPRIWSDDTQHVTVFTDETDTEPMPVHMPAMIEDDKPKTVTKPVEPTKPDSEDKLCEHCGEPMRGARPNRKYCNVNCRNNAYKARK